MQAQEHVAKMRNIVQAFHDDDTRRLDNQFLFLGQILIAITLLSGSSVESAERILLYVF
jgi:hypothetical protein